jgi:thioredoxin-related protein
MNVMENSNWGNRVEARIFLVVLMLNMLMPLKAQVISMAFPAFAGKTYDFIIFQGSKGLTVVQDTIPADGKFTLVIPQQYAPYTGMSRWLLTNSQVGGGLDMAIPGHDFAISCLSDQPDNTNIIFTGFDAVNELNRLSSEQQKIIDRFETMSKAARLYDKTHPLYATFQQEKRTQAQAYEDFQAALKQNTNYNARFLPIVNLVRGYTHRLTDDENEKGELFNAFFTQKMNIQDLYVSGHWEGIIQSWVGYQANVVNDKDMFADDFKAVSQKLQEPAQYTDFVGKVTFILTQYGKDDYVQAITNEVIRSGKITSYEGKTMQAYVTAMVGSQAPDLVITDHNQNTKMLKSSELATGDYSQTLLVFYQSGCGPCEDLLQQLPGHYEALKQKGIDVVAISADQSQQVFENTAAIFPWERSYCDLEGMNGVNFKNYAVMGTPTLVLIDKKGKIINKAATLQDLLTFQQS